MSQTTLHVDQPKALRQSFTVTDQNDQQVATLSYGHKLRTTARATYGKQQWTFTARGIVASYVDVLDTKGAEPISYKKAALARAGTIEIDGKTYGFKHEGIGLLRSRYIWTDTEGRTIIRYTNGGFIKANGSIEIDDAVSESVAGLLVMLGLFIGMNSDNDTVAVAAA